MLSEHAVELRKAIETAWLRHFRNWDLCIDQQSLDVSDPGHLNIFGYGKARHLLKFVGKVACADAKLLGKGIEGQILWVMGMNIARDRIDFLLQLRQIGFAGVNVVPLIEKKQDQKLNKLLMDHQIPHGILLGGKLIDVVQLAEEPFLQLGIKPKNRDLPVENIH